MAVTLRSPWRYFILFFSMVTSLQTAYIPDRPTFVLKPSLEKIVHQGESLLLRCRATGRPQPIITWWKNDHQIKDGENGILLSHGSAAELAVKAVNSSHRGTYSCQAQSIEGKIKATTVVKVKAPPEFARKPDNQRTREEYNAIFECNATGFPNVLHYRWYYNNENVQTLSHLEGRYKILADGSLIIYTVVASDKGNVTCVPDNGIRPSPNATASLTVLFRARVHDMPHFVYAGKGLKAVLTCPTDAEPRVDSVLWKKDGIDIDLHEHPRMYLDHTYSLNIEPAEFSDAGRYTCTPSNRIGTAGESTGTNLKIRRPPHFIEKPTSVYEAEIGKRLSIPCRGGGKPPPNVSWRKKHHSDEAIQFTASGGTLRIDSVVKTVHGTWQCVLKNSVAEVATDVQIQVKYTMPHKIKNITVQPFSDSALRVSWVPGYDGGYQQYFMVWFRQTGIEDPSWATHKPNRSDDVMILGNLLPDTAYEIAVLPVNKLRSGPFSDMVTARTKVPRSITSSPKSTVPRPFSLFASTTSAGLVQLSWKKPNLYMRPNGPTSPKTKILGFLIEYRWTGMSSESPETERSKRDVSSQHEPIPARGRWSTLTNTYENVTSVLVQPEQLYRDLQYQFRALTASESDYSQPTKPVSFSTAGLAAYPCYSGLVNNASSLSHPVLIGILLAVIVIVVIVLFGLCYFCSRKRKNLRGSRYVMTATTDEHGAIVNGKVIPNSHSIVVDLTEKANGGVRGMDKIDFDLTDDGADDEGVETPFLRNSKMEEATAVFDAFIKKHNKHVETDSKKETLSSDRSSVRLRRETTAKVLLEQYKRRSLTDHMHHRLYRDLRLRGGTRSASTSPERPLQLRPDNVNLTSSFDGKGKPRIKLYSRAIDEEGTGQQRRMIIMKRKSQKGAKYEQRKKDSVSGLTSDSSESPVFAVVGTLKRKSQSANKTDFEASSPSKSLHSPCGRQDRFESPYSNPGNISRDVTNRNFTTSPPMEQSSPPFEPVYSSSPKEYYSSPDSSPNRVKARRTVRYDPDDVSMRVPRSSSRSPVKREPRGAKSHSLTYEQRSMYKSYNTRRDFHNQTYSYIGRVENEFKPQRSPDRRKNSSYYVNPGYHVTNAVPPRSRYSFAAQKSQAMQASPSRHQYHPSSSIHLQHGRARSRASYSYSNHRQLSLYSPNPGYDHPISTSLGIPPVSRSAHPSSSDPLTPQSTCEIDCSNSDIEVRFFKDADGNEFTPMTPCDYSGRGAAATSASTGFSQGTETTVVTSNSVLPPSGGNVITSMPEQSPGRFHPSNTRHSLQQRHSTSTSLLNRATSPRNIAGHPTRQRPSSSSNHPMSPRANSTRPVNAQPSLPLAAVGSSDYGSQDTSNLSASPMPHQSAISPQSWFPANERPSRKDNSSVEDNYEWDSEIAMEDEIVEALRRFGSFKKPGPVSDELLDELHKITKVTRSHECQRAQSADILDARTTADFDTYENSFSNQASPSSPRLAYSKESMARRCAALRAEFLHHQQLQQWEEDGVT